MPVLDGAYDITARQPRFRGVAAPMATELEALLGQIVGRSARHLERSGLLVGDAENSYLDTTPGADPALTGLLGHSITYRIAVGPNEGRKAFTLQTLAPALTAQGRGNAAPATTRSPAERHRAMSRAQRLKRVFRIDIERCERCGGPVRIIASVGDPAVIGRMLAQLETRASSPGEHTAAYRPRGPPGQGVLDRL